MKLNNNTLTMKRKAGMTLLELTVVILVLLSLISILFVGARAWKKGSDRSANIMNLRNTQQAVRGYQNMNQKLAADPFTIAQMGDFLTVPTPPVADVTYTPTEVIGDLGDLWLGPNAAGDEGGPYGPEADATAEW